jgi:predicted MFS family arabinose efflux permease
MTDSGLGRVFRSREFRVVWAAEVLSVAGDQLARVALAILVYGRTGSATWSAATYALTFLPALAGGVLLSGLADRFRRRELMVCCDVLRALLAALMAIPRLPLGVLCVLLVLLVLLGPPHAAAQGALLPSLLRDALYERALAVRQITGQAAQLVGFATGGVLVAAISPERALLVNAVTFAVSAVLVRVGVADRPTPRPEPADPEPGSGRMSSFAAGLAEIAADPRRRALVLLAWLVGCYVVPEALAAPYAQQIGSGPAVVGLLMAADPLGSVLGAWLFVRFVPAQWRSRLIGVLAVAAGLPLVMTVGQPGIPLTLLLWGLSGMASTAYLLQAQADFVRATPDSTRGQAIGIAASGIIAAQGVAVLVGGYVADLINPAASIAIAGGAGMLLALVGGIAWSGAGQEVRTISSTGVPADADHVRSRRPI